MDHATEDFQDLNWHEKTCGLLIFTKKVHDYKKKQAFVH